MFITVSVVVLACVLFGGAGICGQFEKRLKDANPNLRNITYDISDLYKYIEALTDMSALV